MKVLFDECIPRPLKRELPGYDVRTVQEMSWASIKNGQLLKRAEAEFDIFITVDRGIEHQQNLDSSVLGFIVLRARSNRLEHLLPLVPTLIEVLPSIEGGDVIQIPAN